MEMIAHTACRGTIPPKRASEFARCPFGNCSRAHLDAATAQTSCSASEMPRSGMPLESPSVIVQRPCRLGRRGMKMAFEGSGRLGPNVRFIRDRGLHWENADG